MEKTHVDVERQSETPDRMNSAERQVIHAIIRTPRGDGESFYMF